MGKEKRGLALESKRKRKIICIGLDFLISLKYIHLNAATTCMSNHRIKRGERRRGTCMRTGGKILARCTGRTILSLEVESVSRDAAGPSAHTRNRQHKCNRP